MGNSSMRTAWLAIIFLLCGATANAQYNYNDEAAGDLDYSDEEAAGPLDYSDETAAGAPGIESGATVEGEVGVDSAAGIDAAGSGAVDVEEAEEKPKSSSSDVDAWDFGGERHFSNLTGPTGGFYIIEAGSAAAGTFGLGLHGAYFKYKNYVYFHDENVNMWAGLNLRVTPIKYLEIFLGLESRANYNTDVRPTLFQALGDFSLGIKGFYDPIPGFAVGGIFAAEFKNPVGEVDFSFKGTSFPLGLLTTLDFKKFNEKIPLRAHFNFIYRFDNTAKLVQEVEDRRGGCNKNMDDDEDPEFDGCLNSVERVGLDIDRTDQFRIGIGLDASVPYVSPIIEYNLDIPVNRQGFSCPTEGPNNTSDSCMSKEGFKGMRQWLTFGVRVLPPMPNLALDFGVDWGLAGYAPSVQELAPQAPYRIVFGLAYDFDPFVDAPEPIAVPCPAALPAPAVPPQPIVAGFVHDANAPETAVPQATVTYVGLEINAQITDANGRFRSYPMPSGRTVIEVAAEGYESATFEVDIPDPNMAPGDGGMYGDTTGSAGEPAPGAGMPPEGAPGETPPAGAAPAAGDAATEAPAEAPAETPAQPNIVMEGDQMVVSLDCPLKAKPKKGSLLVRAVDDKDAPVPGATVKIEGPATASGTTNEAGDFTLELASGSYNIIAEKAGFFRRTKTVEVGLGTTVKVKMPLNAKPLVSSVEITNKRITIKKKIHFETNSADIKSQSFMLLDEVADVLMTHNEVQLVEIQGHTDNKGKRAHNVDLSQQRAESVRRYLVEAGVEGSRLEAKGFGPDKPRAPNITATGRAKNRRVEFHILKRAE